MVKISKVMIRGEWLLAHLNDDTMDSEPLMMSMVSPNLDNLILLSTRKVVGPKQVLTSILELWWD